MYTFPICSFKQATKLDGIYFLWKSRIPTDYKIPSVSL